MFNIGLANLWRLRGVLQVAIPAVVAVDTVRSFYKCHLLYQERLQEWRQEEEQEVYTEVVTALQRVVSRCQARDGDFWPGGLAQHTLKLGSTRKLGDTSKLVDKQHGLEHSTAQHGGCEAEASAIGLEARNSSGSGSSRSSHQGAAVDGEQGAETAFADGATFWAACLGLGQLEPQADESNVANPASSGPAGEKGSPALAAAAGPPFKPAMGGGATLTTSAGAPRAEAATDEGEAAGPLMHDPYGPDSCQAADNTAGRGAGRSSWARALALPSASLKAGWGHVLSVLHALQDPAELAHSVRSGLMQEYGRRCAWLDQCAAGMLRARYEGRVPWPHAELSRASALRFRVRWHGLRWPEAPAKRGGVELVLDGL